MCFSVVFVTSLAIAANGISFAVALLALARPMISFLGWFFIFVVVIVFVLVLIIW
jgi:hypothetical protein